MKALMKQGKGANNVGLVEIAEPEVKQDEIKIKVHAAGICGTDLHIIHDEYPSDYPVVMGHEYSGTVVACGENVNSFQVGDRVVSLTAVVTCGSCFYCNQGLLMLCEKRKSIGSGVNGAFAEYVVVPAKRAYHIPENVSLDEAALTEPLACAVRCIIERGTVNAGDLVLISGPGTIGLLALQVAKANGGNCVVIGTSKDKERLQLAKELGAIAVINIEEADAKSQLKELTRGRGFDVAIECAGVNASLNICIEQLRKQGHLIQMGLFGKKVEFDADLVLMKELHYTNGFATEPTSWEIALRLLEYKQVDIKPLISHKIPLEEWEEAIRLAEQKEGLKVLLVPNRE